MKNKFSEIRSFISSLFFLINIGVSVFLFFNTWEQYYNPVIRHPLFRGAYLLLFTYFIVLIGCCILLDGSKVGEARAQDIIISQILAHILALCIIYVPTSLLAYQFLNPKPFLLMLLAQIAFLSIWNVLVKKFYARIVPKYRMLLLYDDKQGPKIAEKIMHYTALYRISNSFYADPEKLEEFEQLLTHFDSVLMVVKDDGLRGEFVPACFRHGIQIYAMPTLTSIITNGSSDLFVTDTPLLQSGSHKINAGTDFIKRITDIIGSLIAILLSSPLWLLAIILIKTDDGGPIFFRQVRLTRDGREFRIFKFRSMRLDAEKGGQQLATNLDSRITKAGKFLRRYRLDELPQFLNVLSGDMSLVGPRPEVPALTDRYTKTFPMFPYRLKVKAGITGLAQVYGNYATHPEDKLLMDLIYIEKFNLLLDLRILLMTFKVLFTPEKTNGVTEEDSSLLQKEH